jgi:hypothetical protein
MRHDPAKNCVTLPCSAIPPTPTPSSTAWSITPTASISPGRACGKPVNPLERPEPAALWTCRCAWTTRRALPTCPQQSNSRPTRPSSRDSRWTLRLRRCQKPDSQNASRPGRHQNRNGGRDHLGILGEIKSVHPGEIVGISIRVKMLGEQRKGADFSSASHEADASETENRHGPGGGLGDGCWRKGHFARRYLRPTPVYRGTFGAHQSRPREAWRHFALHCTAPSDQARETATPDVCAALHPSR